MSETKKVVEEEKAPNTLIKEFNGESITTVEKVKIFGLAKSNNPEYALAYTDEAETKFIPVAYARINNKPLTFVNPVSAKVKYFEDSKFVKEMDFDLIQGIVFTMPR